MRQVISLQHKALATQNAYVRWLRHYMKALRQMPPQLSSEKKLETFLTDLAIEHAVSASTQNQAFNSILFFYRKAELIVWCLCLCPWFLNCHCRYKRPVRSGTLTNKTIFLPTCFCRFIQWSREELSMARLIALHVVLPKWGGRDSRPGRGNEEIRGILNSGYTRKTAFVVRVRRTLSSGDSGHPSNLATFSSWCPKIIAAIGHVPETLADRCILFRRYITKADVEELKLRTSPPPPADANPSSSNEKR